jgi:hypothetical protein
MFRLAKLGFYALLGYLAYEFYQGMAHGGGGAVRRAGRRFGSDLEQALNEDQGRMATLAGPGRGTTVSVEDSDGASHRQKVGRGVISR